MLTTERMNSTRLIKSSQNEPLKGIWNSTTAAAIIIKPSIVPMASAGSDLEIMISGVEVGETNS